MLCSHQMLTFECGRGKSPDRVGGGYAILPLVALCGFVFGVPACVVLRGGGVVFSACGVLGSGLIGFSAWEVLGGGVVGFPVLGGGVAAWEVLGSVVPVVLGWVVSGGFLVEG